MFNEIRDRLFGRTLDQQEVYTSIGKIILDEVGNTVIPARDVNTGKEFYMVRINFTTLDIEAYLDNPQLSAIVNVPGRIRRYDELRIGQILTVFENQNPHPSNEVYVQLRGNKVRATIQDKDMLDSVFPLK